MQFHEYGSLKKIPFMVTLNGVGVNPTLTSGDVMLSIDGNSPSNVITLPTPVDFANMTGLFEWTPSASETQAGHYFALYIKDASGTEFDTNVVIHYTGGNASARFSG